MPMVWIASISAECENTPDVDAEQLGGQEFAHVPHDDPGAGEPVEDAAEDQPQRVSAGFGWMYNAIPRSCTASHNGSYRGSSR